MAVAIIDTWKNYFDISRAEGLGSSYERIVLNRRLDEIRRRYDVHSVLEAPSFGFTGLSGINSLSLAQNGVAVSLLDHDSERVGRIRELWMEVGLPVDARAVQGYDPLPFEPGSFDMSWNFAAIWFVQDLDRFLAELTRVTSRVIMIGVPNRTGLGYVLEKAVAGVDTDSVVHEAYIVPKNIESSMRRLGWVLVEHSYMDAPPWPDIGMKKEDFMRIVGLGKVSKPQVGAASQPPLTIMDCYTGRDPAFEDKMLRYYWLERIAPRFVKFFWAHHRILRFERQGTRK
jgi:hypothetical protein